MGGSTDFGFLSPANMSSTSDFTQIDIPVSPFLSLQNEVDNCLRGKVYVLSNSSSLLISEICGLMNTLNLLKHTLQKQPTLFLRHNTMQFHTKESILPISIIVPIILITISGYSLSIFVLRIIWCFIPFLQTRMYQNSIAVVNSNLCCQRKRQWF